MYTWVMDFNLKPEGAEAEKYLVGMIREWPGRYEKIDGVLGSMFLANAFGLAGRYNFRMVVDMKGLGTLRAIDQAYKTDPQWKRALTDWFEHRSEVECRLLKTHSGDEKFVQRIKSAAQPGFVYTFTAAAKAREDALVKSFHSLLPSRTHISVVQAAGQHGFEAWHNVQDIEHVEAGGEAAITFGATGSQLFGVMTEVNGALVTAA